ncbi:hypothetical protein CCACVL1_01083, partial [Corchorus capsularis]
EVDQQVNIKGLLYAHVTIYALLENAAHPRGHSGKRSGQPSTTTSRNMQQNGK